MKTVKLLLLSLFATFSLKAAEVTVAAAADLQFAMTEIAADYEKSHKDTSVKLIFGSSGKFYNQIVNGAPFDLYFSADMGYVQKLYDAKQVSTAPKPYAVGRIGLWTKHGSGVDVAQGIKVLTDAKVKKIAIANWHHAPYGIAAKESLEHFGIFAAVEPKFVMGENISQTTHFATSGAAEVAITALSLAKSEELQKNGSFYLLPAESYGQIVQGYGVVKRSGADEKAVMDFYRHVETPAARAVFEKYGFLLPKK